MRLFGEEARKRELSRNSLGILLSSNGGKREGKQRDDNLGGFYSLRDEMNAVPSRFVTTYTYYLCNC